MDPPPTGLLAASTAPPPRQAVFNPYDLPVSPPPANLGTYAPDLVANPNFYGFTGWSAWQLGPLRLYVPTL